MTGGGGGIDAESPPRRRPLTVLPLVALIFYDVSGGPFGIEDSVRAGGGALLPLLGFLILPVLWSLPEALITAELASAFPTNAGYVAWVSAAFGPTAAFLVGFTKWASGTLDNALYPVLFLDYLRSGGLNYRSPPIANKLAVWAAAGAHEEPRRCCGRLLAARPEECTGVARTHGGLQAARLDLEQERWWRAARRRVRGTNTDAHESVGHNGCGRGSR